MYILSKTTLTTEKTSTVLHNPFLLDMSIFNELVINNDPGKEASPFFVFMNEVQPPHDQVLVLEQRTFHRKILSKLYRNSKFNNLANSVNLIKILG